MNDLATEAYTIAENLKEIESAFNMTVANLEDEWYSTDDESAEDESVRAMCLLNRIPQYNATLRVLLRDLTQQAEDLMKAVDNHEKRA